MIRSRRFKSGFLMAGLMLLLLIATGSAQDSSAPDRPAQQSEAGGVDQVEDKGEGTREAEALLRALRRGRPIADIIPPASQAALPSRGDKVRLLPEGTTVVDLTGRVVRGNWLWELVPSEGERPMRLLPNASLEMMVRTTQGLDREVEFSVSGEVTVFEGENLLLVRMAKRAVAPAVRSAESEAPIPAEGTAGVPAAEEVLSALRRKSPSAEPLALRDPPVERDSYGRSALRQRLIPDGAPLVHRPGRLSRDGEWWSFSFESDDPENPEPPMFVLPNQSLELMLRALKLEEHGLVFVVSGEVTLFKGRNYLLPRVALRRADSGNMRK